MSWASADDRRWGCATRLELSKPLGCPSFVAECATRSPPASCTFICACLHTPILHPTHSIRPACIPNLPYSTKSRREIVYFSPKRFRARESRSLMLVDDRRCVHRVVLIRGSGLLNIPCHITSETHEYRGVALIDWVLWWRLRLRLRVRWRVRSALSVRDAQRLHSLE